MANGILKVGEITTSSGSGNITIGSGVTLNSNTPAFFINLDSDQTLTDNIVTKIQFDNVVFDTDSIYSTTNDRILIPSGKAGKYYIQGNITVNSQTSGNLDRGVSYIYKNGSQVAWSFQDFRGNPARQTTATVTAILDLVEDDYIEIHAMGDTVNSGAAIARGDTLSGNGFESWFHGCRIGA